MKRVVAILVLVGLVAIAGFGKTRPNDATSVTEYFVLRDSTTHAPKTDVDPGDIDLYYVEEGAAISSKIDCTALTGADDPYSSGKAFHVGKGLYRIDWPNIAFDGGIGKSVQLIVECAGVDTAFLEVELSPRVDTYTVRGTVPPTTTKATVEEAVTAGISAVYQLVLTILANQD